jgi:hypothetical protein
MPKSKIKVSPYVVGFVNAVKNGTPCWAAITSISKKTGKPTSSIVASLKNAGVVGTQTLHGQPICWPSFPVKASRTGAKTSQYQQWQWFISWCLSSGIVTPRQLTSWTRSPATFVNNCGRIILKQFSSPAGFVKTRATAIRPFGPGVPASYKFNAYTRASKARYRKAA